MYIKCLWVKYEIFFMLAGDNLREKVQNSHSRIKLDRKENEVEGSI